MLPKQIIKNRREIILKDIHVTTTSMKESSMLGKYKNKSHLFF